MKRTYGPPPLWGIKLLVLLNTAYAFFRMWHWKIGFTYFTQLSNLFLALVLLFVLLTKRRLARLRFAATASILITFLVFLTILGPLMPGGLLGAYRQDHYASLCMHLLNPLLGLFDFYLDRVGSSLTQRDLPISLLPPLCYLAFILLLGQLGVRWGRAPWQMLAPYSFLNYGGSAGWFGFCPQAASYTSTGIGVFYAILLFLFLFLGISLLLLKTSGREGRR